MSESASEINESRTKRSYNRRTERDAKAQGVSSARNATERADDIRRDHDEETLSRKTRGERMSGGLFDIPSYRRKPGWDYQGWTLTIHGQPVTGPGLSQADAYEQGWRPVPASEIPELIEPGSAAQTIDRNGQRLMWRPMHLTQAAKQEDYEAAEQQKRDRIEGALNGRPRGVEGLANIRGVQARPLELSIEGEAGAYDRSPLQKMK